MPPPDDSTHALPTVQTTAALGDGVAVGPLPDAPIVPGYDLLGEVARGGMGVVFKARQHGTNRVVAVKTITAGRLAADAEKVRFRAEAEAAAALDHPGIVPIYEVGEAAGQPFFSMKLVEGRSLQAALADPDWKPTLKDRTRLLAAVARAVHHAHQRGIIHRDLKPGNVLLDEAGVPHVADFGLAKRVAADDGLTLTGAVLGTPAYMSPEQAAGGGKTATTLSDVYSLGAILYELLTGRRPFAAETPFALMNKVTADAPDPPSKHAADIDRDLEAVCLKCLAKDPAARYESAAALADDLDRWAAGQPVSVRPPSLAFLVWQWARANVGTAARVALIGFGCSLVGSVALMYLSVLTLFQNAAVTFDQFPNVERPWLLRADWTGLDRARSYGPWSVLDLLVLFVGPVAAGAMGLLAVAAARPRDRWGDLTTGVGVGTIAGFTFTFCGGLQAVLLALVTVPQITRYQGLSDGCFVRTWPPPTAEPRPHPADRFLEEYPDLRPMTEEDRAGKFMALLVAEQVGAIFQGVWLAGGLGLATGLAIGVLQTMTAGYLRRRFGAWRRVVPRYALLTAACYPLLIWGIGFAFTPFLPDLITGFRTLIFGPVLILLAWAGVRGEWKFVRLAVGVVLVAFGYVLADDLDGNLRRAAAFRPREVVLVLGVVLSAVLLVVWGRGRRPVL